jgi:hypothetical protein
MIADAEGDDKTRIEGNLEYQAQIEADKKAGMVPAKDERKPLNAPDQQ